MCIPILRGKGCTEVQKHRYAHGLWYFQNIVTCKAVCYRCRDVLVYLYAGSKRGKISLSE